MLNELKADLANDGWAEEENRWLMDDLDGSYGRLTSLLYELEYLLNYD